MKSGVSLPSSPTVKGDDVQGITGGTSPAPRDISQVDDSSFRLSARATPPVPTGDERLANAPDDIASLLRPLEDDERAAWAASLQLAPYRHALKVCDYQVPTDDIGCLRGGAWLSDAVINAFAELFNARHRSARTASAASPTTTGHVHVFST